VPKLVINKAWHLRSLIYFYQQWKNGRMEKWNDGRMEKFDNSTI